MNAKTKMRLANELHEEMSPLLLKAIVQLFENEEARVVMTTGDIRGQVHTSLTVSLDKATTHGIAQMILPGAIGAAEDN
jgi:hypothetical protein